MQKACIKYMNKAAKTKMRTQWPLKFYFKWVSDSWMKLQVKTLLEIREFIEYHLKFGNPTHTLGNQSFG
jgi:hypothetical protein